MEHGKVGLEELKRFFSRDEFARYVGVEIVDAGEGAAVVRLEVDERHRNSLGMAHGGVLFTLSDMAFAVAAHSRGHTAVAVNTTITFMKAAYGDVLLARAHEVSRNRRLATYVVEVTDGSAEVLSLFQGTVYIKKDPVVPAG
jgi:acyl-CoA thioesterase